jgi:ParB-like chromosome segregation protein Spo0J
MNPLRLEMWPIDKVAPYQKNAKKHSDEQIEQLAAIIERQGWDVPIVVDKDGVIIKGHGRRLAAIRLGLKQVPVIVRDDLTPAQADAARITDNYVVSNDYDQAALREQMKALTSELDGMVSKKELDFMLADLGTMTPEAFIPDLNAAVEKQEAEAKDKADAVGARRVALSKAFGFKDIPGSAEILLTRFLAKIEHETGLKGEAAFIAFLGAGA